MVVIKKNRREKNKQTKQKSENVPDAVLKAVVGRARKNEVGPSKLLDVSQSLELTCVHDFYEKRVQLYMPMDGIVKDLAEDETTHSCENTK